MASFPDGVPCWVDASFPDLDAAKTFYGELFGWTFTEGEEATGNYSQAMAEGKVVAGVAPVMPGQESTAAWSLYYASSDVDATAARIREAGGRLLLEPMDVMDLGRMLFAQDPAGVTFGVWQPGRHQGFGLHDEDNSYAWAEIVVPDPALVDDFYTTVFPLRGRRIGDGEQFDYKVLESDGTPVVGRAKSDPAGVGGDRPFVLVYFAVPNCDDAVATVAKLGGEVRSQPEDSPYGRMAIVTDNQGAIFSVIDPSTTVGEPPA